MTLLARKCLAELVGTAFLLAGVVGSGIMASRLSPDDTGLQLLQNSIATGAVLAAMILALQHVSAAFNPVVTLVQAALDRTPLREAGALVASQVLGAVIGVLAANLMFDLDAVSISDQERSGAGLLLGEVVATMGLVLVIFALDRIGRSQHIGYAVGAYIAAAYWFTSSTSFANPAVTVARVLSDTFAGIRPSSAPLFVVMQLIGGAIALLLVRALYPHKENA